MSAPRSTATKAKTKAAKAEPKSINFDAIRAKRNSVIGEIPPVTIGGHDYTLPNSIPLAITERFTENSRSDADNNVSVLLDDMKDILATLFGPDQWQQIRQVLGVDEVPELFTAVFEAYGEAVGESEPSGQS